MIRVTISLDDKELYFNMNVTHVRERDNRGIFKQFGGYTIASYDNPRDSYAWPNWANRMVIARCSDNDTFSRHEGIRVCIRKIIERSMPELSKLIEFVPTSHGKLIDKNKNIHIKLVELPF